MTPGDGPSSARTGGVGQPGARRDTVRRRREIVDAAKQVFIARGLEGARTREIAAAAGVTPTVLHRYFPAKDDLFVAAVVEPLENLLDQLYIEQLDDLADAPTDEQRHKLLLHYSQVWLETMDEIAPLLGAALFSNGKYGAAFYTERVLPAIRRLVHSLPSTIRGWGGDNVDFEVLALTIFGAYFTVAVDRHFGGTTGKTADLIPKLAEQIVYGVTQRPPTAGKQRKPNAKSKR